jgi:hypothetical protein
MVQTKKMNENFFAKMQKELTAVGELIRARQDEKQALLNEFDSESKRFFFGKISEKALESSVKKTNKELKRLDSNIREIIIRAKAIAGREQQLVGSQAPIVYKATLSGISGGKKKKVVRRAVRKVVKKVVKRVIKKKVVKKKKTKKRK